ncbi:MAG: 50S ribosomal protein L25 [Patescibacteria group bacterium]
MLTLQAKKRTILGKKVKKIRRQDIIPAVVYGHNVPSENIEVERKSFEKVLRQAGQSTIIDLVIDKKPVKVLIHDLQFDPVTNKIIHVDFYQIKEKEKVTVDVELKFSGEAPAVKEKGGILIHHLTKIKIEALPKDLIHEIDVDLSKLVDFHSLIRVKDLHFPPNVRILNDPEEIIVSIAEPKKEEVPTEVEEKSIEEAGGKPVEKTEEEK